MTRPSQKLRERRHLAAFREACPEFPVGRILQQEAPDFLIGGGRVGLEETGIYRPYGDGIHSIKEQKLLTTRVVACAERRAFHDRLPPLFVSVYFGEVEKQRAPLLAARLAAIVACNVPESGGNVALHRNRISEAWWPRELRRVTITRGPGSVGQNWEASGGAECSAPLTPDLLQRRIQCKNSKLHGYRGTLDESWLLLVVDDASRAGHFKVPSVTLAHTYHSGFDRVWLLRTFDRRVDEIQVCTGVRRTA